jgi:hypothetical protein
VGSVVGRNFASANRAFCGTRSVTARCALASPAVRSWPKRKPIGWRPPPRGLRGSFTPQASSSLPPGSGAALETSFSQHSPRLSKLRSRAVHCATPASPTVTGFQGGRGGSGWRASGEYSADIDTVKCRSVRVGTEAPASPDRPRKVTTQSHAPEILGPRETGIRLQRRQASAITNVRNHFRRPGGCRCSGGIRRLRGQRGARHNHASSRAPRSRRSPRTNTAGRRPRPRTNRRKRRDIAC